MKSRPIRRNSLSAFRMEFPCVPKAQLDTTSVVNLAHRSLASNSPVEREEKGRYTLQDCVARQRNGEYRLLFAILRESVPAVVCFVSR